MGKQRINLVGWTACAAVVLAVVCALALADAQSQEGEIGPALSITGNGHALHPVGRMTTVGDFPNGSAVTPNGRYVWVTDCGHGNDDVDVVNIATGAVVQTLALPGCYGGIAITRDGTRAYVGGTPLESPVNPGQPPTKGNQGDVIHIFTVNPDSGMGTEQSPLQLPATSGGSGRMNSLPPTSGVGSAYPEGMAISPDQTKLVVALNEADKAVIVDLKTLAQTLVSTGAYPEGVAFDHQGRAYVSNEYDGTVTVIDPNSATVLATISGLGGSLGDLNSHPEGMVADPIRDRIYVAVTNRDLIATIDTATDKVVALTSVARAAGLGTAPVKLAVSPDGQTLYSADAGEDAVAAISLSQRPPAGAQVIPRLVVVPPAVSSIVRYRALQRRAAKALARVHGSRRAAAIRRYHRQLLALQRRWLSTTSEMACHGPSRARVNVYIRAALRALSSRGARRARQLAAARHLLSPVARCQAAPGYLPSFPALHVIGRLPTAAYPDDVQVSPDGSQLLWVAGKGLGAGSNTNYYFGGDKRPGVTPTNIYGTYVLDKLLGRVGVLPIPSDAQMANSAPLADAQAKPSNGEAQPAGSPVPAPGQGPSQQIKHVFYIVRENRTYDQVFGSDPRGDGDPALELFDDNGVPGPTGGITPNAHALARTFPLIDHFYADSEVSVDGHLITTGGYATDYVQKATAANYSRPGRSYDFGIYPVSFPPNDFIFDQAVKQGISFRDYGEAADGGSPVGDPPNRPTFNGVEANTDNAYPNNLFIGCLGGAGATGNLAACTQDSGMYNGTGKTIASKSRFDVWYPEFQAQVAQGTVPALNYMILPNDHTNGTTSNDYTPQALIADNDLALGQIVDAISHSSIWSSTAIFVVEDDSQDGADHVDAHRMPAFVISPWARRGAVVHTRYDQYSVLRTLELITGIDPLSLNDGEATPMYDTFISGGAKPDDSPYNAIAPKQDIGEINGSSAPMAALSDKLPWDRIDEVPQEISDQILWASVHGAGSTPPPRGPNASLIEHDRAVSVRAVLTAGGNALAYLSGSGDG